MTTQELIHILEDMDPNSEVRFASQPNWPFEYSINDVIEVEDTKAITKHINENEEQYVKYANEHLVSEQQGKVKHVELADEGDAINMYDDDGEYLDGRVFDWWPMVQELDGNKTVYLGEGRQIGYLPGNVKEELGW